MESIYEAMAASFIASLRKYVIRGMTYNAQNALYNGVKILGYIGKPDHRYEVDDEVFRAVQAKLEANKRGGKGAVKKLNPEAAIEDYWLSGKIYCGLCGGTVQGASGTGRWGGLYHYYSCKNHRKHACELKSKRKEDLESIVLYLLDDLFRDPALRMLIAEACYEYHMSLNNDSDAFEESIKAKLKEVENKLANSRTLI